MEPNMLVDTVAASGKILKRSMTPALRKSQPRARWRASWIAEGLTRGRQAGYGDLKKALASCAVRRLPRRG